METLVRVQTEAYAKMAEITQQERRRVAELMSHRDFSELGRFKFIKHKS